jgi:hypothetical protein
MLLSKHHGSFVPNGTRRGADLGRIRSEKTTACSI